MVRGAHRENGKVGAAIGSVKDDSVWQDKGVLGDILFSVAAN
jgi:hypothetical protein